MIWLLIFVVVWVLWKGLEADRDLREFQRLQRRFGCAEAWPSPQPPSPHQLLGDVARPVPTKRCDCYRRRPNGWLCSG